jgi:hypothetical protein
LSTYASLRWQKPPVFWHDSCTIDLIGEHFFKGCVFIPFFLKQFLPGFHPVLITYVAIVRAKKEYPRNGKKSQYHHS